MSRLLVIAVGVGLLVASPAWATQSHMQKLPLSGTFRCLNCHSTQDPPTAALATLNTFGVAFRDHGFKWDTTLASMRSDGDNCTNGFELGDENGDGRPDQGLNGERSNPGQNDCSLQINEQAWSALKALFR
jgi:hypothetical protein